MNNTALITGASSGIGKELARLHASKGGDLVIVARRRQALDELKSELESAHRVQVVCIDCDLTDNNAPNALYAELKARDIPIDLLINNAGFGGHGRFHEREWALPEKMIQLNIAALSEITHLFLGDMVKRKRGRIMNVASTAAFMPGPMQAVYYATKAYILSFTQAIAEEVRKQNITVTALCPGAVDTEFADIADINDLPIYKNAASPQSVARVGYNAMMKGRLVVINDWKLSLMLNWVLPLLPRRAVLKVSRHAMKKP